MAGWVPDKDLDSIATIKELATPPYELGIVAGHRLPSLLLGTRLVKPFIGQAKSPFGGHKPSVLDSVKNASLEFVWRTSGPDPGRRNTGQKGTISRSNAALKRHDAQN